MNAQFHNSALMNASSGTTRHAWRRIVPELLPFINMLIPHRPLQAYALDTAQSQYDPGDERWLTGCLAFGVALEEITEVAQAGTPENVKRLETIIDEYELLPWPYVGLSASPSSRISELTSAIAVAAEDRGALQTAYSTLTLLERLYRDEVSLEHGRVLALKGRIARKGGEPELADELYRRVTAIARRLSSAELSARALIGRGVLAQSRGNYPEARRSYTQAAKKAVSCGDQTLIRLAYHGMMVVSAKFGDFRQAFAAGWRAFEGAQGDPQVEADTLINLSQLAFDVGQPRAALHGFAAALARDPAAWLRLPALGGAARAAAAIGHEAILRECADRIETYDASNASFVYSRAAALLDACRAFVALSLRNEGARLAARVFDLATAYGFYELVIESELIATAIRTPHETTSIEKGETANAHVCAEVDAESLDVLERLTSLEQPDRVLSHR